MSNKKIHDSEEEQQQQEEEQEVTAPVVVPKSAMKKPGKKVITLSMRETMNLLEPDTRVFSREELMKLTPEENKHATQHVLTPWHARCADLTRFYVPWEEGDSEKDAIVPPRGPTKKKVPTDEEGGAGGGGEADDDEQKFVEKDFVLSFPYSEVPIQPGTMAVRHELKSYGNMPVNSWLFAPNNFVDATRKPSVQSRMFGRAMQQIGHRVLAGNYDVLGSLVTKPMMVAEDGSATPPAVTEGELDWSMAHEFDKKLLDASAVVYAEWSRKTPHFTPRLTEVKLERCTLAQYIAALEKELETAHTIKALGGTPAQDAEPGVGGAPPTPAVPAKPGSFDKRDTIVGIVSKMLATAKSYTTAKHATNYVLPPGPHDPNNVVLELHVHHVISSVKIANSDLFDKALKAPEKSTAGDPQARIKGTCVMLAKKDNTARMVFTFSVIDGEPGEQAEAVHKMMIVSKVPIVPFNRYLYELDIGIHSADMKEHASHGMKKKATATATIAVEGGVDELKTPVTKAKAKPKVVDDPDADVDDKPVKAKVVAADDEETPAPPVKTKAKAAKVAAAATDDEETPVKAKAKAAPVKDDDEETPAPPVKAKAKAKPNAMDEDDTPAPPPTKAKAAAAAAATNDDTMDADEVAKVIAGAGKKKVTLATPAKVKLQAPTANGDNEDGDEEEEVVPAKKATPPAKATPKPETPAKIVGNKRAAEPEEETPAPPPTSNGASLPISPPTRTPVQQKLFELLATKVAIYGDKSKSEAVRFGPFASYDGGPIAEMSQPLRVAFVTACHALEFTQLSTLLPALVEAEKSAAAAAQPNKKSKKQAADDDDLVSTLGVDQAALDMLGD